MAEKQTKLIIVESPAKAKTISKLLGKTYNVEASQGHIRDLPKSKLGIDTENNFEMNYITIHGRGEILAELRKQSKKAKQIFLATDPDREGEAISWHLAKALKIDEDAVCRVAFHEITKKAVLDAIKHPRKINMSLVDAQQARRALDRLVGYKISPLLWAKVKKGLSAGRVQSVATRLVVDREQEIEDFIPEEYWDITADFSLPTENGSFKLYTLKLSEFKKKKPVIACEKDATDIKSIIAKSSYKVGTIKTKEKKRSPAAPFTTSTLQQEASRKLNFTITKTMQVVQQLYEGIDIGKEGTQGLVTYIRTDSVRVSEEALQAVRKYIEESYGKALVPKKANEYKGKARAQDAHEAIRPTDITRTPDLMKPHLTREQFQLYKLIHARFVASQMEAARYNTLTVSFESKEATLKFYGEDKVFAGFTAIYEESFDDAEEIKPSKLPALKEGESYKPAASNAAQHFTQAPPRFTEASLVHTLEDMGIGRPSTYAPTIATILSRGYISREKKRLYPTELGLVVNKLMKENFSSVVDFDFTADMENKLDEVEEGKLDWKDILSAFYPPFIATIHKAEEKIEKITIEDEKSDVVCDLCGATMVYKNGRFGRFLACPSFPACKNTKPILNYIHVPCPKCGGALLEKISKKNRKFFGCENYPDCDFVSWEKPIEEKCPVCGSYMTLKNRKKGEVWKICANEICRHSEEYAGEKNDG